MSALNVAAASIASDRANMPAYPFAMAVKAGADVLTTGIAVATGKH